MKSLAIVGFGPTRKRFLKNQHRVDAVWSINNSHAAYDFPTDRIVAMDDLKRDIVEHPKYVDQIVTAGVPVVTSTAYPDWPSTSAFPIEQAIAQIGDLRLARRVLTNSWCYALLLAIMEGVPEVWLYGAEFESPDNESDLLRQRNKLLPHHPDWFVYYDRSTVRLPTEPGIHGLTFLMGMAIERGIGLRIPMGSSLMDWDRPNFFYGYQEQPVL